MNEIENPAAFPHNAKYYVGEGEYQDDWNHGLTMRDYFAAKHLQGISSDREMWLSICRDAKEKSGNDHIAKECYSMADSMLKARIINPKQS